MIVAVRVPDSVEYCRARGFDIERWLFEGLVDLLIATCYFQLNGLCGLVGFLVPVSIIFSIRNLTHLFHPLARGILCRVLFGGPCAGGASRNPEEIWRNALPDNGL